MMKQPACSRDSATSVKRSALQSCTRQSSAILEKFDIAPMKRLYRDSPDRLPKNAARLSTSRGSAARIDTRADASAEESSGRNDGGNSALDAPGELVGAMLINSQTMVSPSASMRRRESNLGRISTLPLGRRRQSSGLVLILVRVRGGEPRRQSQGHFEPKPQCSDKQ